MTRLALSLLLLATLAGCKPMTPEEAARPRATWPAPHVEVLHDDLKSKSLGPHVVNQQRSMSLMLAHNISVITWTAGSHQLDIFYVFAIAFLGENPCRRLAISNNPLF